MTTQTAPVTGVESFEQLAATLYPTAPAVPIDKPPTPAVAELRKEEGRGAGALYADADQLGDAPQGLALALDPTLSPEAAAGHASTLASVMTDIGLGRDDVAQLSSFTTAYANNRPTDAERQAHERSAVSSLRDIYGERTSEVLADARALAQRDPRVTQFLNQTGLGSHPWVVLRLAEVSQSARNQIALRKGKK